MQVYWNFAVYVTVSFWSLSCMVTVTVSCFSSSER